MSTIRNCLDASLLNKLYDTFKNMKKKLLRVKDKVKYNQFYLDNNKAN